MISPLFALAFAASAVIALPPQDMDSVNVSSCFKLPGGKTIINDPGSFPDTTATPCAACCEQICTGPLAPYLQCVMPCQNKCEKL